MCKKIVRVLAWFLAAVLASILLLAAAIRVDQYVLRYRAERLQSDIRSLELRKSTFADARRLEDRWFDNTKEEVCRPSWCDLDISLNNTSARHLEFLLNHLAVRAIYHSLGGRVAGAHAFIQVRDNILWGKGIGLASRSWIRNRTVDASNMVSGAASGLTLPRGYGPDIPNIKSAGRTHARGAWRDGSNSLPLPTHEMFCASPTSTSPASPAGGGLALNRRTFFPRLGKNYGQK
jgi:hypothetical protein